MSKISLAVKYRPKTFDNLTEQTSVKLILEQQLETDTFKNCYLFTGRAGSGKAQPLYSKVLTPAGFIRMGDIKLGDTVITRYGDTAKVTEIYPQGSRDIYEITLQDRTRIRVADNHLNVVYRYNQSKKCREEYVLETTELIDLFNKSKYKLRIDIPSVDFAHTDVNIDPYLLGALIGDGSLSGNFAFSNSEKDVISKVDTILANNYNMTLKHVANYDYAIRYIDKVKHNGTKGNRGLHSLKRNFDTNICLYYQLKEYGLLCKSINKYIPENYLINSKEIRLQLLQGLLIQMVILVKVVRLLGQHQANS